MDNKTIATIGLFLAGMVLGWVIWGSDNKSNYHVMSDSTLMSNDGLTSMQHSMDSMTLALEGKTGDEFDKEFLAQMILHHEGAVEMANQVLATSKRPELIQLANEIISAQTKEIKLMTDWQNAWFK